MKTKKRSLPHRFFFLPRLIVTLPLCLLFTGIEVRGQVDISQWDKFPEPWSVFHIDWRNTTAGRQDMDWYVFMGPGGNVIEDQQLLITADGSGGTYTNHYDERYGPFETPEAVCAALPGKTITTPGRSAALVCQDGDPPDGGGGDGGGGDGEDPPDGPGEVAVTLRGIQFDCTPACGFRSLPAQPGGGGIGSLPAAPGSLIHCRIAFGITFQNLRQARNAALQMSVESLLSEGLDFVSFDDSTVSYREGALAQTIPSAFSSTNTDSGPVFDLKQPLRKQLEDTDLLRYDVAINYTVRLNELAGINTLDELQTVLLRAWNVTSSKELVNGPLTQGRIDVIAPELGLTCELSSSTGTSGDRRRVVISVSNHSNVPVVPVVVRTILPPEATYVDGSANFPPNVAGNRLQWVTPNGPIPAGGSDVIGFDIQLAPNLARDTQVQFSAHGSAAAANPWDPSDRRVVNAHSDPAILSISDAKVGVDLQLTADRNQACYGQTVTYTATIRNLGDFPLESLVLDVNRATLGGDPSFPVTLPPLGPGQTTTFTYRGSVGVDQGGALVEGASITGVPRNGGLSVAPPVSDSASVAVTVPVPAITQLSPTTGVQGAEALTLTIDGACFAPGAVPDFRDANNNKIPGITLVPPQPPNYGWVNLSRLVHQINVAPTVSQGTYFVYVINPSGLAGTGTPITTFTVQGQALPNIQVSPSTVDFGDVSLGDSVEETLVISNTGGSSLEITDIRSQSDDVVVNQRSLSIPPNGQQEILLTYTPSTLETVRPDVIIESNDPDTGILVVPVIAAGVQQEAQIALTNIQSISITNLRRGWFSLEELEILNADHVDVASRAFGTTIESPEAMGFGAVPDGAIDDAVGPCCGTTWHPARTGGGQRLTLRFPTPQDLQSRIRVWDRQDGNYVERLDAMLFEFFDAEGSRVLYQQVLNLSSAGSGVLNSPSGATFEIQPPRQAPQGVGSLRLTNLRRDWFYVEELEIPNTAGEDIASTSFGTTVQASEPPGFSSPPDGAIDDRFSPACCSDAWHSSTATGDQFLILNFPSPQDLLGPIRIWNRPDGLVPERLDHMSVEFFDANGSLIRKDPIVGLPLNEGDISTGGIPYPTSDQAPPDIALSGVKSIIVTNLRRDWFYLEELDIRNADGADVASTSFGTTLQASENSSHGSPPTGAIDDQIGTCCGTGWHSSSQVGGQSLTLTFPSPQDLQRTVRLWNRQDGCCVERLDAMSFQFLDAQGNLTLLQNLLDASTTANGDLNSPEGASFEIARPQPPLENVKTIQITNLRNDWFYLEELHIPNTNGDDLASIQFGTTIAASESSGYGSSANGAIDDTVAPACCGSGWHSSTENGGQSLTLTLPAPQDLEGSIQLWNRQDGLEPERLDDFLVTFRDPNGTLIREQRMVGLTLLENDPSSAQGGTQVIPDFFADRGKVVPPIITPAPLSVVLTANASELDFGTVEFGKTADQTIFLSNRGTDNARIQSFAAHPAFELVAPSLPLTLPPNGVISTTLRFHPDNPGSLRVTGAFRATNGESLLVLGLSGTGSGQTEPEPEPEPEPELQPSINSVTPVSVNPGGTIVLQGTDFGNQLGRVVARLNDAPIEINSLSPTQIELTIPETTQAGRWRLAVHVDGIASNPVFINVESPNVEPTPEVIFAEDFESSFGGNLPTGWVAGAVGSGNGAPPSVAVVDDPGGQMRFQADAAQWADPDTYFIDVKSRTFAGPLPTNDLSRLRLLVDARSSQPDNVHFFRIESSSDQFVTVSGRIHFNFSAGSNFETIGGVLSEGTASGNYDPTAFYHRIIMAVNHNTWGYDNNNQTDWDNLRFESLPERVDHPPTVDSDGDGVNDLIEEAFLMDPNHKGSMLTNLPQAGRTQDGKGSSGRLSLSMQVPTGGSSPEPGVYVAGGFRYEFEISTDVLHWELAGERIVILPAENQGASDRLRAEFASDFSASVGQCFARITVSRIE